MRIETDGMRMLQRIVTNTSLLISIMIASACGQIPQRPQAAARPQPPAAAQLSAEQAQALADANEYRLGPGDTVKITVYDNKDLMTEADITQAGKINFPLIGEVTLGGLTKSDAERAIAQRLSNGGYIPKAHVNVLVTQYRSQQVSVLGEVNKPGMYPLSQQATVTDVLAMA